MNLMSLFSWLFARGAAAPRSADRPSTQRLYLIDASGMLDYRQRNGNSQPNPRDNFAVLRTLSQFASREGVELTAVFVGRPLREAGEGSFFRGVRVHYTDNAAALKRRMLDLVREHGRKKSVLMLTADTRIEAEALALGAECMRLTTFKKALDEREPREQREREQRPSRPSPAPQPEQPAAAPARETEKAPAGDVAAAEPPRPETAPPEPPRLEPPPPAPPRPEKTQSEPPPPPQEKPSQAVLDLIDPL